MLRTSLALALTVAFCATASAAPGAPFKTRAASLTKRAYVMPFTVAEKMVMDRASASWGAGGDGGGGDGGGGN